MRKPLVIIPIALVIVVIAYLAYDLLNKRMTAACDTISQQTELRLGTKLEALEGKGELVIGREKIKGLTERSEITAMNLKTCCTVLDSGKVNPEEFLKCKNSAEQYEAQVEKVVSYVNEAQAAQKTGNTAIVNEKRDQINQSLKVAETISSELVNRVTRLPKQLGGLSIPSAFDKDLVAQLQEAERLGAVVIVKIALSYHGKNKEGGDIANPFGGTHGHLTDYGTGKTYDALTASGFTYGTIKAGEEKILNITFPAPPKEAKEVGITVKNIGTFQKVKLAP